jgi:DNA-binding transcriptional regulator YiaG
MPNLGPRTKLLRQLRSRLGELSQEQLAQKVGVSWSTVSRWENGKGSPSPLAREKLVALMKEANLSARMSDLDVNA